VMSPRPIHNRHHYRRQITAPSITLATFSLGHDRC
jgi:hypothetical protein